MKLIPQKILPSLVAAVVAQGGVQFVHAGPQQMEEILVTADFRQAPEMDIAASLSVVDSARIQGRAAQHLDEILNVAPNVNFSAGASRGRYLQIRGIGERSQFVDPINPSVGLTVDGINLSGVGNVSTLFDIQQVEVLRGPQGTRFGASALAGMVNMISKAPTEEFEGRVGAGIANEDTWSANAMLSGPLTDNLLGRLAIEQYRSDGFIDNEFLRRDDTNNRDELTARGKLRWLASEDVTLDITALWVDVDNGYDAFSLDNNRTTLSDQPGVDAQQTKALSLALTSSLSSQFEVQASLAFEKTDVEYGYDEDWTNTQICAGLACDSDLWGFDWWYSSTDNYQRERQSYQMDVRLVSSEEGKLFDKLDWVAGIYAIDQQEDLTRDFFDWDLYQSARFDSQYDTRRLALYGQLALPINERTTLTLGGRVEDFRGDYDDSRAVAASPDETLWGGDITLEFQASDNTMLYGLLSRGFKAGGVNGEALGKAEQNSFDQGVIDFLTSRLVFDTETASNLEVGLKGSYWNDRWQLRLAAFYMKRDDVQLKGWYNEGPQFVGYTDNGASGENQGLELETSIEPVDNLRLFASLGLLDTEIKDFFILNSDDELVDKTGRDQAHAPRYQFSVGGEWTLINNLLLRIETEGRDAFYFSDSHDEQSDSYALVHASINYDLGALNLKLWGRNLTDKDYAVRGFYFANDPREFYGDDQAYIQLGDPRTYGLTATYSF